MRIRYDQGSLGSVEDRSILRALRLNHHKQLQQFVSRGSAYKRVHAKSRGERKKKEREEYKKKIIKTNRCSL
jgi:hypothetical protein